MASQSCFNFHFPITEESLGINSDIFCCLLPKSFGGFNFFLLICRSFFFNMYIFQILFHCPLYVLQIYFPQVHILISLWCLLIGRNSFFVVIVV